ncbi:MAG: NTP transferase domain-containing protein [Candidatus Methylomirabilis sp.]|nr:NTP transferase domain-containing protein [Deltaproteobacteria bacterium]
MDAQKVKSLTIGPEATIKSAMQSINDAGEKILFVTDELGSLIGVVTDGDIRRGIINGLDLSSAVRKVMRPDFICLSRSVVDLKKKAKALMKKHLIEYVPVLNRNRELVDIISWIDCLNGNGKPPQEMLRHPVVIMAGGMGTRLDPFTKILPKPLIPYGSKPIIEHIMDGLHEWGFHEFILVLNYKKEVIKLYFGENRRQYSVEFVEEDGFCGTAGGVSLLKDRLKSTFILTNCDTILETDYREILRWHGEKGNMLTIIGSHREVSIPYGVLNMANGSFVDIREKPKLDFFINTGTYVLEPEVLDFLERGRHADMDYLITLAKKRYPEKVSVFPSWGNWFDIGKWDEYRMSLKRMENVEN